MKNELLSKKPWLALAVALIGLQAAAGAAQAQGTWAPTASAMSTARDAHAMLIVNNKVLVIGGRVSAGGTTTARTDYYDPATNKFTTTGSMYYSRSFFPPVLLNTGRVLAPGGYRQTYGGGTISSCEVFDPKRGRWSRTGSMAVARELHSGTKLPNGNVLVAGGFSNNLILNSAELYSPSTGAFRVTGSMILSRFGHTATLLGGRVFVTGGRTHGDVSHFTTEFYDPATGLWSPGSNMNQDRYRHTATTLLDGRILIAGGYSSTQVDKLKTMEIYDPATGVFTLLTDPATGQPLQMTDTRMDHTATLLPDGRVLIAGGWSTVDGVHRTTASVDVIDPVNWSVTPVTALPVTRHEAAALLLPGGKVFLTGGLRWEPTVQQTLNSSYVFSP